MVAIAANSGNLFCGPTPNYQLAICPRFRQNCSSTAVFPIICPAAPPLQPPVPQNGSEYPSVQVIILHSAPMHPSVTSGCVICAFSTICH